MVQQTLLEKMDRSSVGPRREFPIKSEHMWPLYSDPLFGLPHPNLPEIPHYKEKRLDLNLKIELFHESGQDETWDKM